ncbi:enoyl-CoA hydratase-related protein [Sulfuracidifex metallicus]|uniref:Enoyl-CoA hydratase n=2 Tax=Sulfuracidifex metallicus TaxID=47303 RepID=A0A6A9QN71_SULME|nr:enoyl-CoA hydratase-related protein [Sulfuracidifex metallicus]MUN29750.1 enoyl-CoA hydratase [Sulfuracidifex metallicus DSM 6482 = JCM 9184]WOE51869.1 enoyl-CoA hydratase-related protein [Sulfuracidifex metallicus DSM 6482 = JCM 9184]
MSLVKLEDKGKWSLIVMRGPKLNALSREMRDELLSALRSAKPVTVLTGESAYCVGADVTSLSDIRKELEESFHPLLREIRSDRIVISVADKIVAGACLGMFLASDVRIASPGTRFVTGFQGIGLAPDTGVALFLRGYKGMKMAVLGGEFTAEEGEKMDLLEVSQDPMKEAERLAEEISRGPLMAYLAGKKMINVSLGLENFLRVELEEQSKLAYTEDFREGVSAFKEKRRLQFKGK